MDPAAQGQSIKPVYFPYRIQLINVNKVNVIKGQTRIKNKKKKFQHENDFNLFCIELKTVPRISPQFLPVKR